jgi:hypothetical protein
MGIFTAPGLFEPFWLIDLEFVLVSDNAVGELVIRRSLDSASESTIPLINHLVLIGFTHVDS